MKLLVLPGDGIGPEIVASTVRALEALGPRFGIGFDLVQREIGLATLPSLGTTMPQDILPLAGEMDGLILGPISTFDYPPRDQGGINASAALRTGMDLYANIRPARTRASLPHRGTEMDLVILRENTEGMYPDRNMFMGPGEFMPVPGVALSVRKITRACSERIARRAFELARRRRGKVTAVHKANAFQVTDGLFLSTVREVHAEFPDIELNDVLVDAMTAHLVRDASRYDVICTTNFYGDILSDLASELSGSLGLAGSLNASDSFAMAQAQHGSAPDIAGKDFANPASMLLSTAMLLDWYGERKGLEPCRAAGAALEAAVDQVFSNPATRTRDLGGKLGTRAITEEIIAALTA